MSDIRSSKNGSNVSKAVVAGRRARARSAPEGEIVGDGEPENIEVTVDMDALFDDTGMLPRRETSRKERKILSARPHRENPDSVVDPTQSGSAKSVEARLAEKREDLLKEIYEKVDEVPGTLEDLIVHHGAKLAGEDPSEVTKDDFKVPITGSDVWLESTWKQQENPPVEGGRLGDDDWHPLGEDESNGAECPECGSTNTLGDQQQTGSSDEGPTGFHVCQECDHKFRSGY